MTVLVLTSWFDVTADHVVQVLNGRSVPVFRCDMADFPARLTVRAALGGGQWAGQLRLGKCRIVDLSEITGIWWRRPGACLFPEAMHPRVRDWAMTEARIGLGGLLAAQRAWLNHPHASAAAEYKPLQLAVAAECGLSVPRTLITNGPEDAAAFCREVGDVVYKPFGPNAVTATGDPALIYTSPVTAAEASDLSVAATACMFQERIDVDHAVRAVVIDGRVLAGAIYASSPAARMDWRADYDALTYRPIELPAKAAAQICELVRRLGLRFGALDLLAGRDGTLWFLEINPNGQWAWIDHLAGPVAEAIADALVEGTPDDECRAA